MKKSKKAVVLFSGGLDSATVLHMAIDKGFEVHAMTVDYGQLHSYEINCAKRIAEEVGVKEHRIPKLDLSEISESPLTGTGDVPLNREDLGGIAPTYVPARNLIFLSLAVAWAETLSADVVFIGVNNVDYSGYPDCRPEFISAFQVASDLGTAKGTEGTGVSVHAPLINMAKKDIILEGLKLGVNYSLTNSCYSPREGEACGQCDSCMIRQRAFEEVKSVQG